MPGTLPPPPVQPDPPCSERLGPGSDGDPQTSVDAHDGSSSAAGESEVHRPRTAPHHSAAMRAHGTAAAPVFAPNPSRRTVMAPSVAIADVRGEAAGAPSPVSAATFDARPQVPVQEPEPAHHEGIPRSAAQPGAQAHAPVWSQLPEGAFRVRSSRGEYLVGRQIGAGHFGAVFECLGPFDQRYALKVLRPTGRPIARVREEWTREVRRLLALRHPNVVYIHDAFEWQGSFCVALEWCDHTLRDMLEQPLREELAIELSRQMLAAVQYLHDSDLVHDDLHPRNVLIQQADRPIVKISDFGISTELRGAAAARPELVHHAIMAPELLAVGYTSKQSDLYQLGLILYWLIAGHPPMNLDVPYQVLVQQIADGVARQRAEALGTPFGAIVAKLLRRRDVYRYTSAREVWFDLRQLDAWRLRALFPVR